MSYYTFRIDDADSSSSDNPSATPSPPIIQASQVEDHYSQGSDGPNAGSQDTVILDQEDEAARPVINEVSILRVVSSTQSFVEEHEELQQNLGNNYSYAYMHTLTYENIYCKLPY